MNRIRQLREQKHWKQKDIASFLHTSQQTIARYETGERGLDVDTINKLCNVFDVTSDYLLGRSNVPKYDFTPEELVVIDAYRRLSPTGQEYIRHSLALAELAHSEKNRDISKLEAAE